VYNQYHVSKKNQTLWQTVYTNARSIATV
jgi:hypothetical protein